MKKVNFKLLSLIGLLAVAIVGIVTPEFAVEILAFVGITGAGTSGVVMATLFSGPATVDNANTLDPEHLARYVSKEITKRNPDVFALDTIMRSIRKAESPYNVKVEYEELPYRPFEDTIATGFTQGGTATSGTVIVSNAAMWAVDDTMRIPGVLGGDGNELVVIITAINRSNSTLTITANNGIFTGGVVTQQIPTIAGGLKCYRTGNAKAELDAQTEVIYTLPNFDFNFCQIQMAQLERSKMESKHKAYSGMSYAHKREQVIYDYRSRCEATNIFGAKGKKVVGGDVVYFADGIYNKVSNVVEFGTGGGLVNPNLTDLLNLGETVFAGNAGSKEKILLGGKKVLTGLAAIDKYDRNISYGGEEVYHGVKCTKLISPFGKIMVVHSRTMDEQGKPDEALVIDPEYILKHDLVPFEVTPLELNKSGQRNVLDAMRWEEQSCLTIRYAGTNGVHAIFKPSQTT
jgi:hypothetical protein